LTCQTNIDRLNKGPDNWKAIIGSDQAFIDYDFSADSTSLFWEGHLRDETEGVVRKYSTKVEKEWKRPSELV
jgi:hypothetical protein